MSVNQELRIQLDDSMPLGELLESAKNGEAVKRSAHIGNMFGADLVQAALGMRMVLVDANYGQKDSLYFPQAIISPTAEPKIVAPADKLSFANSCLDGTPLNQFCLDSIVRAFGNTDVEADTEMLLKNRDTSEAILNILLPKFGYLFSRRVDSNGRPARISETPLTVGDIAVVGESITEGAVIPNEINILIDFVLEALRVGGSGITHISGPTMFIYIKSKLELLNAMYQELAASSLFELPDKLDVRLVPASGLRFVSSIAQREDLEEVISLEYEYTKLDSATKEATKALAKSKLIGKETFDAVRKPMRDLQAKIGEKVCGLPGLLYVASPTANLPNYVSQFTAIEQGADGTPGSGLFIPDFMVEQPIAEVTGRFKTLENISNGRK